MKNKNSKNLMKFAFWNKKTAKKIYDLNKKSNKDDVFTIHAQKCGLCGS